MKIDDALLQQAAHWLASSKRLCVLTGAGMSRESGIPTFRDPADGWWAQYEPRKVATVAALHENPQQVLEFHAFFRAKVSASRPNAGHRALATLERLFFPDLSIITQNVDDLHERAGSTNVVHLHGQLMQYRCSRYCQGIPSNVEESVISRLDDGLPRCPHCGALVRPNVTLFGEFLHSEPLRRAENAIVSADLLLVIGTSGVVAPASELPQVAKSYGLKMVEINPQASEITPLVDLWLPAPAAEALPRIGRRLLAKSPAPRAAR